mmetsp:Transcript_15780/g.36393  ORF Transcript_15780/g.36393 Transcript_15780/m.36393 type:complete len:544 (+) Transcript_15780:588-2219(+)
MIPSAKPRCILPAFGQECMPTGAGCTTASPNLEDPEDRARIALMLSDYRIRVEPDDVVDNVIVAPPVCGSSGVCECAAGLRWAGEEAENVVISESAGGSFENAYPVCFAPTENKVGELCSWGLLPRNCSGSNTNCTLSGTNAGVCQCLDGTVVNEDGTDCGFLVSEAAESELDAAASLGLTMGSIGLTAGMMCIWFYKMFAFGPTICGTDFGRLNLVAEFIRLCVMFLRLFFLVWRLEFLLPEEQRIISVGFVWPGCEVENFEGLDFIPVHQQNCNIVTGTLLMYMISGIFGLAFDFLPDIQITHEIEHHACIPKGMEQYYNKANRLNDKLAELLRKPAYLFLEAMIETFSVFFYIYGPGGVEETLFPFKVTNSPERFDGKQTLGDFMPLYSASVTGAVLFVILDGFLFFFVDIMSRSLTKKSMHESLKQTFIVDEKGRVQGRRLLNGTVIHLGPEHDLEKAPTTTGDILFKHAEAGLSSASEPKTSTTSKPTNTTADAPDTKTRKVPQVKSAAADDKPAATPPAPPMHPKAPGVGGMGGMPW